MEIDATPPPTVDSVSVGNSPDVTPGEDHVAMRDAQVEFVAAKGIKLNPRKWVKKRESRIRELDKLIIESRCSP